MGQEVVNQAVLCSICEILNGELVEAAVESAIRQLEDERHSEGDRKEAIGRRLHETEAQIRNLVKAVSEGGELDSLVQALKAQEEKKETLRAEFADIEKLEGIGTVEIKRMAGTRPCVA